MTFEPPKIDTKHAAVAEPLTDMTLLLVHGIGQQVPGSVVDQVGNALLAWLSSRLSGSGNTVQVERALLRPKERGDPGGARLTLLLCDEHGVPLRRLRLVESLWAEEFEPPGFFEVLRWILGPGAWLLFRHIVNGPARGLDRMLPDWPNLRQLKSLAASLIGFVTLFVAVLPLQLIGVVLAILRLVPIPYLRTQLNWLGLVVSEVLGDSYLFARNPVVRRALADRIHRDLDNLNVGSAPVAVLAHSQGAALALDMLERRPKPPPLVTYGAGIRKLHEVVETGGGVIVVPAIFYALWWLAPVWLAALVGAMADISNVLAGSTAPDPLAGISWLVLVVFYLVGFVLGGTAVDREKQVDASLTPRILRFLERQPAWLDLYASHDPVPAGPLVHKSVPTVAVDGYQRAATTGSLDSLELVNGMSASADHTSYWDNPDGFIDPLVHWLRRELGQSWLPEPVSTVPAFCKRRGRTRVRRWVSVILLVQVIALWLNTLALAKNLLPAADTGARFVTDLFPAVLSMAKPLVSSVVMYCYGAFSVLLLLALNLAGLAVYEAAVLSPVWQSMTRYLVQPQFTTWFQPLWRFVVFMLLFLLAAYALGVAFRTASYEPLVQIPVALILAIHRFIFVGG